MSGLRTLLQPICAAVFLIVILLHSWAVSAHAETTDPGQINFRQDIKDTQDEFIDPYTGVLRLKYIDYSLPGNSGLDLNIYRVYSSEYATDISEWPGSQHKGDWSRRWQQSPLGFGWAIHFGRMSPNGRVITVELQDGTKSRLIRQPDGVTWISAEFWKLTFVMSQGKAYYTLYLPDGRQIEFGKFDDDNLDLLHYRYATKISYNGSNDTYITINYEENSRRISSVVDSLGRVIYFNYSEFTNGLSRLTSLGFQHPNNHIVKYFYEGTAVAEINSTVTRVETGIGDPDSEQWTYEYKKYHDPEAYTVEKVHTPMGGSIQYIFDNYNKLCYGTGSTTQFSVKRKILYGNGFVSNAIWNYNYTVDVLGDTVNRYVNYSTVTDPDQRTTYYYFTDYQSELEDCFKCGLLQKKFIMEPDVTPFDPTDNPISYAEINTWEKLDNSLSFDGFYADCQCDNSTWSVPVLKKQVILHGQDVLEYVPHPGLIYHWTPKYDNASVFTTEYLQHDEYGNPTEIRETGSLYKNDSLQWSSSRYTTNSYWIEDNGPYYIVKNKPDIVAIQGESLDQQTSFGGSFTIDYDYGHNINDRGKVSRIDQYGIVAEYGYHSNGNLHYILDGDSNELNKYTYYSWDNGSVSKIETPEYEISRVINPDGTVHSETNGRGFTTSYSYYQSRRVKQISPPKGNPTTFTYFDADGFLAEKNESRGGFVFTTKYNGLGKEIETTDSMGITTNTSYYASGLLSSVSSNTGDTVYYDYFGRMSGRKHLGDTAVSVHYDYLNDAELLITDEEGFITTHLFKYFGDPSENYLTEVIREVTLEENELASNDDILYQYNVLGNLTHAYRGDSYTNDFHEQGSYTYYPTNTLQQQYHSETGATSYTRWNNGEVKTITDSLGRTRTHNYDRNNRLDEVLYNNVVVKDFKYDGEELWKAASSDADIIYGYDESSRLTSIDTCINFHPGGPTCKASSFAYDNNDNLRFLTYPSGMVVEYKYNALNQVTDVILHGKTGGLKEIRYFTTGSSIGLLKNYKRHNGKMVSFTYDSRRRQDKMNYPGLTLDYDFNVRNNLFRYTRTPWSQPSTFTATYTYDSLNRIRHYNGPWGSGEYIYYPFTDNRKSRSMGNGFQAASYTYSGNTLSQYKTYLNGAWHQKAIDFDSSGDMTVYGDLTFDYDPFHMATEVKKNSATIAEYGYDANDQRVFKKAGGFLDSNVLYYHDGKGRILSEFDDLDRLIYDYVYLGDTLVAKVGYGSGWHTPPNMVLPPIIFLLTNDEE